MKHSAITRTISDIKIPNWLIKSELFGNGYVPVYTIPGLADEKDAYDCAVEFLKRQNEHKHY